MNHSTSNVLITNKILTIVMPYGSIKLCQHWLSNGLLTDSTKTLPGPNKISKVQWHSSEQFTRYVSLRWLKLIWKSYISKLSFKSFNELKSHLSGANELINDTFKSSSHQSLTATMTAQWVPITPQWAPLAGQWAGLTPLTWQPP